MNVRAGLEEYKGYQFLGFSSKRAVQQKSWINIRNSVSAGFLQVKTCPELMPGSYDYSKTGFATRFLQLSAYTTHEALKFQYTANVQSAP